MRTRVLATLAVLCAITRPAHAQIVEPGTQPGALMQPLQPEAQCSECHVAMIVPASGPYMPADLWPNSLMANAEVDPLFLAALTVAEQDTMYLGQFCLRCHSPVAFTNGDALPGYGTNLTMNGDTDGVNCETCHRDINASAIDSNAPYVGDARLFFDDGAAGVRVPEHGPYTDPFASPRHDSVGDPFQTDSRMCGQCHDVDNPWVNRLAADGTDTGMPFPLQTTYTEYAQSTYADTASPMAKTCQDCHMPGTPGMLAVSNIPHSPLRLDPPRHDFVGGNAFAMQLLLAAYPGLNDDGFATATTNAQAFLQTAAQLAITAAPTTATPGTMVPITVTVTNLTGHKLPTGFEDARVMWLQVAVNGTVISGAYASDALVEDSQLRAYRFVAGQNTGTGAVEEQDIAHHNTVMEDSRIPPLGMVPDPRTLPVGRDYSSSSGSTLNNFDTATFQIPVPTVSGPATVTVNLLYQLTTAHYVQTIASENTTDDRGTNLLTAWNATGRAPPLTMATQTTTFTVTGGSAPDGGPDAESDAGSDAGSGDVAMDGGMVGSHGCSCETTGATRGTAAWPGVLATMIGVSGWRRRERRSRRR